MPGGNSGNVFSRIDDMNHKEPPVWHGGDIISSDRWSKLSKIVPVARQVQYYNNSNNILDIQYQEAIDLDKNGCMLWGADEYNGITNITTIHPYNNFNFENVDGRLALRDNSATL